MELQYPVHIPLCESEQCRLVKRQLKRIDFIQDSKNYKNQYSQESMDPEQGMMQDHFPVPSEVATVSLTESNPKAIHQKLNSYDQLDTEQRLTIVKNLPVMLEQLGNEGHPVIKPLLYQIIKDRDSITRTLLEKLPDIISYLEKHQHCQEHLKSTIIPILIQFLNFNQLDIKEQAGQQLGQITHKLNDKDRGDFVLKHVIEMAHDDSNEDNRIVAVQLFSTMSDCFGKQLCEQFIGLEILSLGDDSSVKVRKQAIKHLPIISKLVSKNFFTTRFSQFYLEKAKDNATWAIRKACVDIIIQMAQLSSDAEKQGSLSDIMLSFLKDSNKWVRLSAYKHIGKFIFMLKGLKINQRLIQQYCKMTDNDVNSIGRQNQVMYNCAFNFPAVVDALGPVRWPQLYKVYQKLLKSSDKKIKITMSESLHEIAKIIGQQNTQKYLFKVIDMFFKQKNDEIKLGIIKHLAAIMQVLSVEKRQSLIGVFQEFQKDQKKWRIRECIGKQLGNLLEIYSPEMIFQYMVPLLLKFCSDSVSIVRQEAAEKVADFIKKLSTVQGLQLGLIESVKAFGTSPKYTQRQSFLMMCGSLMKHKQLFQQNFLNILIDLKNDKVINVKLALAELVKRHMDQNGVLSTDQKFVELYKTLKQDKNQQISSVFVNE